MSLVLATGGQIPFFSQSNALRWRSKQKSRAKKKKTNSDEIETVYLSIVNKNLNGKKSINFGIDFQRSRNQFRNVNSSKQNWKGACTVRRPCALKHIHK